MINPMTMCDGYKLSHRQQYPVGTTGVYSNMTPRSSRVLGVDYMVSCGLQYFNQKYLVEEMNANFFQLARDKAIAKYQRRIDGYLGPNGIGTDHIGALHELGFVPLEFRALPEGTRVPLRVPMLTVEETIPEFFWMTNYIESLLSCTIWGPCTSATTASVYREILEQAAFKTGTDPGFIGWQAHDFSFRGMMGLEAAMLSGMGHLLFFTGTDTIPAMDLIEDYYGVPDNYLLAGSVAATEHSVMCAGGDDGEMNTFNRLLDLYPTGVLSVVSDTWDLWNVLTVILPALKDKIMARNGKLVIRPDSGDPVKIICGNPDVYDQTSPVAKGVIQLLWEVFGGTLTSTGHKALDSHIGAIYGDSITPARATEITQKLKSKGFASGNIVFGVGSYTYQYVTRDTFGTAMKATDVTINGQHKAISKKPVTDDGTKNSAKGRLAVHMINDKLTLIEQATPEQEALSLLEPVWRNGNELRHFTFPEVRATANGK